MCPKGTERRCASCRGTSTPSPCLGSGRLSPDSSDERASETQRRVDSGREAALTEAFVDAGIPRKKASTLAQIGLGILIGTQQQTHTVDRRRLAAMFDEYQSWLEASMVLPRQRRGRKIS